MPLEDLAGDLVEVAPVSQVMAAVEAIDLEQPWPVLADRVIPVLPRRRPLPTDTDPPIRRTWPPGIVSAFGLDIGPAFLYIGPWALERWGVTEDELAHRAVANVRDRSRARRQFGLLHDSVAGTPVNAFQSRDGWASTLLLVPDELTRAFGPEPSLILAPMRDLLLQLPIDTDPDLASGLLDAFASLDPNGLAVPVLALLGGELHFAPGTVRGVPRGPTRAAGRGSGHH